MPDASGDNAARLPAEDLHARFAPDYTPEQLENLGVYDALYRGQGPRLASLGAWKPEWISEHDPKGWAQWYKRYAGGRRIPGEDERQIKRWLSFKSRHGGPFAKNPTPRRGWALRNWAVDPTKLVPEQSQQIADMLDEHQRKAMQKYVREKVSELLPDIQLQEHQQRVADRVSSDDPRLLVYHGLGSGKSLSALAAAEAARKVSGGDYGIVVPASLRGNFQKEIKKFTRNSNPEILSYTALGAGKQFKHQPDTLIMDEAARLRNPNAAMTRAALQNAGRAKRLLLLTGTPITNEPKDLASLISIIRNEKYDPAQFDKDFVGEKRVWPSFWGFLHGARAGVKPVMKNGPKLRELLKGHVDYQPSKTPEGVNVNEELVNVPLSKEQQRIQKALRTQIPPGFLWKLDREFPLSRSELAKLNAFMTGLRQVSLSTQPFRADKDPLKAFGQSAKLQEAFKRLRTTLDSDPRKKAIIYSNFVDAGLSPYAAGLDANKIPYGIFHGGIATKARQEALKNYNEGKLRALLIGPAGAEGISTKGTSLIQLLDPYWNESRLQQAQGRGLRFDSHDGLPEDLKNVAVQRFLSSSEEPGILGKYLLGQRRQRTGDEVIQHMSAEKEKLNEEFRKILREVGSEKTEKTSAAPVKKKSRRLPGFLPALGGVGALSAGAAYGLASDAHAKELRNALNTENTPLGEYDTAMTRYSDVMSQGAKSAPFGMPIGSILSKARSNRDLMTRLGVGEGYVTDKPGRELEARKHYELFGRGPIAAYHHMLTEARPNQVLTSAAQAYLKQTEGGGPEGASQPRTYGDVFGPRFMSAYHGWMRQKSQEKGGPLEGAMGWVHPQNITTKEMPHEKQMEFLREYVKSLPPELRKEDTDVNQSLDQNKKNYLPIFSNALKARDALKNTGITLGGATAGGALGHGLYKLLRGRAKKDSPLAYWASVLGGTGLGGLASYYGGTEAGRAQLAKLFAR